VGLTVDVSSVLLACVHAVNVLAAKKIVNIVAIVFFILIALLS
jgi:hypothetical protein